jgi:hypothetical protein
VDKAAQAEMWAKACIEELMPVGAVRERLAIAPLIYAKAPLPTGAEAILEVRQVGVLSWRVRDSNRTEIRC